MAGKRKRGQGQDNGSSSSKLLILSFPVPSLDLHFQASSTTPSKPLSAVAAAKLRSRGLDDTNVSGDALLHSRNEFADSNYEQSNSDVDFPVIRQNLQLCSWRYGPDYVSSETEDQLTVSLGKNATIALIGCYEFVVLRGAVNINGGNFAAARPSGEYREKHRVFMPSTHPISSIKGLDNRNEVQFMELLEPTPFASLSPLFQNIWNANRRKGRPRSFALVSCKCKS